MSDNTAMLGLTSLLGIGGVLAWMYASQEPVKKKRGRGRGKKRNVDNDEDEDEDDENDYEDDDADEEEDIDDYSDNEELDIDPNEGEEMSIYDLDDIGDLDGVSSPKKRGRPKRR